MRFRRLLTCVRWPDPRSARSLPQAIGLARTLDFTNTCPHRPFATQPTAARSSRRYPRTCAPARLGSRRPRHCSASSTGNNRNILPTLKNMTLFQHQPLHEPLPAVTRHQFPPCCTASRPISRPDITAYHRVPTVTTSRRSQVSRVTAGQHDLRWESSTRDDGRHWPVS